AAPGSATRPTPGNPRPNRCMEPRAPSPPDLDPLRAALHPLGGSPSDYDPLLERIGDARLVLIGEASHGTHEFYRERATITRRLITEKGFTAVALEADWPDAHRVHRFISRQGEDDEAIDALGAFRRFPAWMWRNADVLDFIGWLRQFNEALPPGATPVGLYGLDLYSLFASIRAVIDYLDRVDPDAAQRARYRYSCFDHFDDPESYGFEAALSLTPRCRDEVLGQLAELHRLSARWTRPEGGGADEAFFSAERNARLAASAEHYYRTLFGGPVPSWNLRDQHMAETLDAVAEHIERNGRAARIVVWAHNSHLGDARATDMARRGELNLGQLVRERHGRNAVLIGLTTHHGTVTAADNWDEPARRKRVRPALPESYEAWFHALGTPTFLLFPEASRKVAELLRTPRLERAIGVVYRPATERTSHYFQVRLADQFDAVVHFDETRAVEPLDRTIAWELGAAKETFPYGV
ncbi:MAG TPA: erythromycin esterase family protein, partial [Longimicrobiales bacterium]